MQRLDREPKRPRLEKYQLALASEGASWSQRIADARDDGEKAELYYQRSLERAQSSREAALSDVRRALRLRPDEPKVSSTAALGLGLLSPSEDPPSHPHLFGSHSIFCKQCTAYMHVGTTVKPAWPWDTLEPPWVSIHCLSYRKS